MNHRFCYKLERPEDTLKDIHKDNLKDILGVASINTDGSLGLRLRGRNHFQMKTTYPELPTDYGLELWCEGSSVATTKYRVMIDVSAVGMWVRHDDRQPWTKVF